MGKLIELDRPFIRAKKRLHDESHCDSCKRELDARHDRVCRLSTGKLRCERCAVTAEARHARA